MWYFKNGDISKMVYHIVWCSRVQDQGPRFKTLEEGYQALEISKANEQHPGEALDKP